MFLGTHQPRLDEKGRLFLPAKFRDDLAGGLVITKGQERCLYVFPAAEFAAMTERMAAAPVTSKAGRNPKMSVSLRRHPPLPGAWMATAIPYPRTQSPDWERRDCGMAD